MIILGLHDNHSATATLLVDGEVLVVTQEERYTRNKMDGGFPKKSIDMIRKEYPDQFSKIDLVAVGCISQSFIDLSTKRYPNFTVRDFLIEEKRYWLPKSKGKSVDYLTVMNEYVNFSNCHYDLSSIKNKNDPSELLEIRKKYIADYVGISSKKVVFVDHHEAHAHHSFYSSNIREDSLVFTIDGWGDHANATVSKVEDGRLKSLYRTENFNLGRVYHFTTLLLGMQPEQHEYKVMGLAAYAKPAYIKEPLKVFEAMYKIDGTEIKPLLNIDNHYQYLKENLEGFRFDAIAGAVQKFSEDLMTKWVDNWIAETGLSVITLSGCVALNIKASKKISELKSVKKLHICLGAGDESLSIGAAQCVWNKYMNPMLLKPINNPYLDLGFDLADINKAVNHPFVKENYNIIHNCNAKDIAEILSNGNIVAYMHGRMEFGPRALGHRSILASPKSPSIVDDINLVIKNRDFWMPFTPSILDTYKDKYLINPKNIDARFMTMAFESTSSARNDIPAAMHQIDSTLRAQVVDKQTSPEYYNILCEFEKITGIGGMLNTSLNIHGKPIVHKPIDVINEILTHDLVELKYVVFDNVLLKHKGEI